MMYHTSSRENAPEMSRRPWRALLPAELTLILASFAAPSALAGPPDISRIDEPNENFSNQFVAINNHGEILGIGPSLTQPNFLLTGGV